MKKCEIELKRQMESLLGIKNRSYVTDQAMSIILMPGDYLDSVVVEGSTNFKIGTTNGGGEIYDDTVSGYEVITVDQFAVNPLTIYFSGYSTSVKIHLFIQKAKLYQ